MRAKPAAVCQCLPVTPILAATTLEVLVGGGIAVFSAIFFAIAAVLQQRAAYTVPKEKALGVGFVQLLFKRPEWVLGFAADIVALLLQAVALAFASLLVVQPLLVVSLVFAIPAGAWLAQRELGPADYIWGAVLVASIVVFFVVGRPTAGVSNAPFFWGWAWTLIVLGPLTVTMIIACIPMPKGPVRTLILATVAGIFFGVGGALLIGVVAKLEEGILGLVEHWGLYMFIAMMAAGQFYQNSSYESGNVEESLPATTVLKPIVAMLIGITVLQETIRLRGFDRLPGLGWALIGASVTAMCISTIMLARSAASSDPRQTVHSPRPQMEP